MDDYLYDDQRRNDDGEVIEYQRCFGRYFVIVCSVEGCGQEKERRAWV
jgi:hypothetical protein